MNELRTTFETPNLASQHGQGVRMVESSANGSRQERPMGWHSRGLEAGNAGAEIVQRTKTNWGVK